MGQIKPSPTQVKLGDFILSLTFIVFKNQHYTYGTIVMQKIEAMILKELNHDEEKRKKKWWNFFILFFYYKRHALTKPCPQ